MGGQGHGRRAYRIGAASLAALLGVCGGLGGYTFWYAQGASYLSNDPRACVNCHIMRDQFDGWQKSSHHAAATCNDCHVPHQFFRKYLAKGSNGYHHSKAFTFQSYPDTIRIKPHNAAVLQENCLRCHGELVSDIVGHGRGGAAALSCARCHADVGHGPRG
ncbi:MAG: cytochrome c nitrite reductase small subunit [Lentisphaerae bacterium]|nr:cytochrome c nitrite reductase small subunit [Lentisphaerota bacterium]